MTPRGRLIGIVFAAGALLSARDLPSGGSAQQLLAAAPATTREITPEGWSPTAPGVIYRTFGGGRTPLYHVARVDLREPGIRTFVSGEADRGKSVSEVAARHDAIAAVNGDYFDEQLRPIGYSAGPCGEWTTRGARSSRRESALLVGRDRATVAESPDRSTKPQWADFAISGWPKLVEECRALGSRELPGSDAFTRSPHARSAVGVDATGRYLFLITASPTQHVRGATLPELATFMKNELGICEGMNLDGGGSTSFVVGDERRQPEPQFAERPVANHLLVVPARNYPGCELSDRRVSEVSHPERLADLAEILAGTVTDGVVRIHTGFVRLGPDGQVTATLDVPSRDRDSLRRLIESSGAWVVVASDRGLECRSRVEPTTATHALRRALDRAIDASR